MNRLNKLISKLSSSSTKYNRKLKEKKKTKKEEKDDGFLSVTENLFNVLCLVSLEEAAVTFLLSMNFENIYRSDPS